MTDHPTLPRTKVLIIERLYLEDFERAITQKSPGPRYANVGMICKLWRLTPTAAFLMLLDSPKEIGVAVKFIEREGLLDATHGLLEHLRGEESHWQTLLSTEVHAVFESAHVHESRERLH